MTIRFVRIFFVILSVVCGYYLGSMATGLSPQGAIVGAAIGFVSAVVLILLEVKLQHVSLRNLSAGAFGLVFGFLMAWIVTLIIKLIPMNEGIYPLLQIVFTLIFCYLGMTISIKGKDEFNLVIPYVRFSREDQKEQMFLLDTSVIIDGRIAGICETGFLKGRLVIPRFVLHELQQIADSSDDSKRNRGRRGLDMLNRLKKIEGVEVIIHDESLSEIKGVDAKLVRMGKILACSVLTNDFNLNKVAKIEGVEVLNINDLADSLKPVVFPGEQMNVYIRKEGKERNQGVAFMDDGTMIVVDNARKVIGKSVNVAVTSVLQTSAGRMVFAELIERVDRQERPQDRSPSRPPERRDDRQNRHDRPERHDRQDRHERPQERHGERRPAETPQNQQNQHQHHHDDHGRRDQQQDQQQARDDQQRRDQQQDQQQAQQQAHEDQQRRDQQHEQHSRHDARPEPPPERREDTHPPEPEKKENEAQGPQQG